MMHLPEKIVSTVGRLQMVTDGRDVQEDALCLSGVLKT